MQLTTPNFQARFLASPDHEFAPIGARSGIKYRDDFNAYKKVIISTAGKKRTKEVFAFFNKVIFSHSSKPGKDLAGQPHDEEAVEAAMRAMEETTDEDEELDQDPTDTVQFDDEPDEETLEHHSTSRQTTHGSNEDGDERAADHGHAVGPLGVSSGFQATVMPVGLGAAAAAPEGSDKSKHTGKGKAKPKTQPKAPLSVPAPSRKTRSSRKSSNSVK